MWFRRRKKDLLDFYSAFEKEFYKARAELIQVQNECPHPGWKQSFLYEDLESCIACDKPRRSLS